jgi:hypothetical protein
MHPFFFESAETRGGKTRHHGQFLIEPNFTEFVGSLKDVLEKTGIVFATGEIRAPTEKQVLPDPLSLWQGVPHSQFELVNTQ